MDAQLLADISNKDNFPSDRWEALKKFIYQEINIINLDTFNPCSEPDWWYEMMEIQRMVMDEMAFPRTMKPDQK